MGAFSLIVVINLLNRLIVQKMSDEYDFVSTSSLKLKDNGSKVSKKKKKKSKEVKPPPTVTTKPTTSSLTSEVESSTNKTKAELIYEAEMEKRKMQTMLKRAEKTYKQRIVEFNDKLNNMTEFYDIQKVSWTK